MVFSFASCSLGKPKELNFQLWLKLSETFMKDPVWSCGNGVASVWRGWRCGFLCDKNTYPSLGLVLRPLTSTLTVVWQQREKKKKSVLHWVRWDTFEDAQTPMCWWRKKCFYSFSGFPYQPTHVCLLKKGGILLGTDRHISDGDLRTNFFPQSTNKQKTVNWLNKRKKFQRVTYRGGSPLLISRLFVYICSLPSQFFSSEKLDETWKW